MGRFDCIWLTSNHLFDPTQPTRSSPSNNLFAPTQPTRSSPSNHLFALTQPTRSSPSNHLFALAQPTRRTKGGLTVFGWQVIICLTQHNLPVEQWCLFISF